MAVVTSCENTLFVQRSLNYKMFLLEACAVSIEIFILLKSKDKEKLQLDNELNFEILYQ